MSSSGDSSPNRAPGAATNVPSIPFESIQVLFRHRRHTEWIEEAPHETLLADSRSWRRPPRRRSTPTSTPRVLSPHNADAYSIERSPSFPAGATCKGDAKVYEVYKYLADRRTGIYPMGAGAWEGRDSVYEFGYIRDPVKMINVYSVGYCDMLGPTMAGIMQDMGIGPARTLNLPGWGHVVAEVFYDGKWHYLDLDVRAVFRRDGRHARLDGRGASRTTRSGRGRNSPLFFPLDNLENTREGLRRHAGARSPRRQHGRPHDGLCAAPGRDVHPLVEAAGRPLEPSRVVQQDAVSRADLLEHEPRGPKCKHPSFTIHTRGNGRFVYAPDLTDRSSDFADGVYDAQDVRPGPAGLDGPRATPSSRCARRTSSSRASASSTPPTTTREASVVKLDASGVTPSVSVDNGLTWTAPASLDLTPLVTGRYGYLLKLDFAEARTPWCARWRSRPGCRCIPRRSRPAQGEERDAVRDAAITTAWTRTSSRFAPTAATGRIS